MFLMQKSEAKCNSGNLPLSPFFLTGCWSVCMSVPVSQDWYGPVGLIGLDSLGCAMLIFNLQASYKPSAERKGEGKAKTISHPESEYRYTVNRKRIRKR